MSGDVSDRKKVDVGARQRSSRETASSSFDMSVYKSSTADSLRYKGRKELSVYKSSDDFFQYSCGPCSSAGDHSEVEGFCTDCGEYLCGMCFRSHSRGKATKQHTLLNKDNMARIKVQTCDPCKTVGEKIEAIGYCDDCDEYLCRSCFKGHSRSKATKHHNLIDKGNMSEESFSAVASSIAKIDVRKDGAMDQKPIESYNFVEDINVKAAGDARNCYIVAMTQLSNHEIVLADYDNVSLKHVDVARNVINGTLGLESVPFGLTTVSKDEVAVSLPNIHVIRIVTISGTISVQRNFKLTGQCLDIEYLNGKLYVSFEKSLNFKILQPSDEVYKTTEPDAEVLKHCKAPRYIAVSPNESVIYMSDWTTNKVVCMDMDGNMISMYQSELDKPKDIVITPFGSVYLCNKNQHVIYKMAPDLSESTVILGPGDGLFSPLAMCFNFNKQHLYISFGSDEAEKCNHLKVFKWQ